ncbi:MULTISPECIES: hypothetical protein [Sphingobium]|jgi:hypothetical protein|uniref:Uncharacterized protein n=1 Tax=Sphingobium yanoikuyae TaxID=13690 RepID=A0AA42WS86_SPHYA|nr:MULTISPECIES: hypothetical protein [Sphingobium]MDF0544344.1 hypothetical protein [Sphingobium arseniciresistens]MBV2150289.1 hypothetical protein [Sphingobium sp. AS12]MDH2129633.1 hypothetical protein [Sphingobium yanoikuyae]MDH2149727.1 hypothetical protein [Sphingobium yanoikuyae]MDH2165448.1 hypothetical protein [Sphingobium yanoikuyae]|tara:strand:- start:36758 stop:37084 length:327 start_codon:yes stop_codon:yes gene_type:complete
MSNSESLAVARLQRDVPGAEARIDDAIIALSTLMTSVVTARREIGVAAKTGQATIIRLAKAQMSLIDISNDVLRAHGELADIGKETAGLDLHECPSMAVAPPHLAAVA